MKIFLVQQDWNSGYDTYDSFVIICETEEEARITSPYGNNISEEPCSTWVNINNLNQIKVTYLGEAKEGSTKEIVCKSFNAG